MVEETLTTKLKTEMTEKSVTQMIEAARHDPQKFEDLYLLYVQPVFRYLYSRIRNTPDAEDATAQTFLAALEQYKSINTTDILRVGCSQSPEIRRWIIFANNGKRHS